MGGTNFITFRAERQRFITVIRNNNTSEGSQDGGNLHIRLGDGRGGEHSSSSIRLQKNRGYFSATVTPSNAAAPMRSLPGTKSIDLIDNSGFGFVHCLT